MKKLYDKIGKKVAREARLASNRWNGMVDAEDIEQELWMWILESSAIQNYLYNADPQQLKAAVSNKLEAICSEEKLAYEHFSGQFVYTPKMVRELLDTYYASDVPSVSPEVLAMAEENLSQTMVNNILGGSLSVEEKVDIEQGLQRLVETNEDYYDAVVSRYRSGNRPENKSQEHALYRGVDKLTEIMNLKRSLRESERTQGPGTRPSVESRRGNPNDY